MLAKQPVLHLPLFSKSLVAVTLAIVNIRYGAPYKDDPPIGAKIDAGHLYHALRLFRATGATAVYRR